MIPERPEEPGKKYALAFTLTVHVLLLAALVLGVQWKRSPPEVFEVELWSPRAAVQPPPPEPEARPTPPEPKPEPRPEVKPEPPPPKKPDIAVREEKKKPEPKKPEPQKPEPKPEPKKPEPKPEPAKKAEPKVDPFKEMLEREERQRASAQAAATTAQMKAAAEAEARAAAGRQGTARWIDRIRGKIRSNIALPPGLQGNPSAHFTVVQLPTGEVIDVRMTKSSGNSAYDAAIERAIHRASPLPKPDDAGTRFERELRLTFCPNEELVCK